MKELYFIRRATSPQYYRESQGREHIFSARVHAKLMEPAIAQCWLIFLKREGHHDVFLSPVVQHQPVCQAEEVAQTGRRETI